MGGDAASPVQYTREGDVVVITLDDGKMNSFGFTMCAALNAALDRACEEEGDIAVLLLGNKKAFSAGFDLKVMGGKASLDQYHLFNAGLGLALRLAEFPRPVVMGSTGHGLALGAILLLTADIRIGKRGAKYKYGMNEVAIGMTVPPVGVELARHRMPKAYLGKAVTHATIFGCDEAVAAGFLDACVDESEFTGLCMAEAARLAALKNPGYHGTKLYERGPMMERIRLSFAADAQRLLPKPGAKL